MRITTLIIIYEANITLHLQFRSITLGFVAFLLLFCCSLILQQHLPSRLRPYITTNEDFPLARASFSRAASSILSTNFIRSIYYAIQT